MLSDAFTGALQKLTFLALIGSETHVMGSMVSIGQVTVPATLSRIQTLRILQLDGQGPWTLEEKDLITFASWPRLTVQIIYPKYSSRWLKSKKNAKVKQANKRLPGITLLARRHSDDDFIPV